MPTMSRHQMFSLEHQSDSPACSCVSGVADEVNIKHNWISWIFGQWITVPGVMLTLEDILEYLSGVI